MTLTDKLETLFWQNHRIGKPYEMKNRDGSIEKCKVAYYPLDMDEPTALIEIERNGYNDFREVPIRFLSETTTQPPK